MREQDDRISNTAVYYYNIIPRAPILFNEQHQQISNSYNEDWAYTESWDEDGYKVYASDKEDFNASVTDGSTLYYTFSDLSADLISDEPTNIYVGNNAENQWVKISNSTKELKDAITKLRIVRLVNVFKGKNSSVSTYYLGVKPGAVSASPLPQDVSLAPASITLTCYAPPEAKIYYTLNGSNPRTDAVLYETPIILSTNKTIKAVSYYEGIWGDVYTFTYTFTNLPEEKITAFNPPGSYEGPVGVSLLPTEPGKKVFYAFDGGAVQEYNSVLTLDKNTVITAYVEGDESNVHTFEYVVKPLPPVFAPEETVIKAIAVKKMLMAA